jgi:hypothetical protein
MTKSIRPFRFILISAYLLFGTGLLMSRFSNWTYDDPFITYRYANNLAAGFGMVYNLGERVLSTTTPLFTLLLASLSGAGISLSILANMVGAFSLMAGALFLWDVSRSWNVPLVGWVGLLFYPTFPLIVKSLGSETPLYLAFCLSAISLYARKQYIGTGVLVALAFLTRPDGLVLGLVLIFDYLKQKALSHQSDRKSVENSQLHLVSNPDGVGEFQVKPRSFNNPWNAFVIFSGLTLPWNAYAWIYYGSPIPATLTAKQYQGSMVISESFSRGLFTIVGDYLPLWHFWLLVFLAAGGLVYLIRKAPRWGVFTSWMVVYFLGYSILGVSRYFWYYAPLVPGFLVLVGLGAEGLSKVAGFIQNERRRWMNGQLFSQSHRWGYCFTGGILFVLLIAQVGYLEHIRAAPDGRYLVYREIGEWLQANTDSTDKVGALEVGILGYYSDRYMVDFAGLIQPDVAIQLLHQDNYENAVLWAINNYHPEYLVLHDGVFSLVEKTYVKDHCKLVKRFPGENFGNDLDFSIYVCDK